MKIESLAYYLPPKVVTSEQTVERLPKTFRVPLREMTGIESVRKVAPGEYALSLSVEAVKKCLMGSQYTPAEVDAVICCNICSYDHDSAFSYEPCTASRIARQFGMNHALCFDINNACAGVFTGLYVAQSIISAAPHKKVLVVSGECISILAETVFKQNFNTTPYSPADLFACLTLGDSGVALLLEHSDTSGFQTISLETLGDYSHLCTAFATEHGPLMVTSSVRLAQKAMHASARHLADTLAHHHWDTGEGRPYLIPHQTARKVMESGRELVNQFLHRETFTEESTIVNIRERGNTSSTTHWVAIMDMILDNRLQNNDRVAFSVAASGITVGSALYIFDDLPARVRANGAAPSRAAQRHRPPVRAEKELIFAESVAHVEQQEVAEPNTFNLAGAAVAKALARRPALHKKIGLIIFCGTYKSDYLSEPSVASMLLRAMDLSKEDRETHFADHLFAFDIKNGALGMQTGLETAARLLRTRDLDSALIVSSEVLHPTHASSDALELTSGAAALVIAAQPTPAALWMRCSTTTLFADYQDSHTVSATWKEGTTTLKVHSGRQLARYCQQCMQQAIHQFFEKHQTSWNDYPYCILPSLPLSEKDLLHGFDLPKNTQTLMVYAEKGAHTHGTVGKLQQLCVHARSGDRALVVQVASGLQVNVSDWSF